MFLSTGYNMDCDLLAKRRFSLINGQISKISSIITFHANTKSNWLYNLSQYK